MANDTLEQSGTLALIGLAFYGSSALVLWSHFFRSGRKGYMLCLTIGMSMMTLGFTLRKSKSNYAWSFLVLFLTPTAFLAQNYVLLSRLCRAVGPSISTRCLRLPVRGIIWIFVMSDLVTFCSQTAGTVFVIIGGSWLKLGTALEIAGLALAIVSYLWFMWIGYEFFWKLRTSFPHVYYAADGRRWTWKPQPNRPLQDVALLKLALLISSIGIVIRSIFRLVEQADGFFGFIASHEVFFWLFDAIPLWICTTVYCFVWPPRIIEACAERDVEQNLW